MAGKRLAGRREKRGVRAHMGALGFTNRLAVYILLFLAAGLVGGFYLARLSIRSGYVGALACWTVVFTPIGTACSIVLSKIVHKSEAENTGGNGDGIKYAVAMNDMSDASDETDWDWESPMI